MQSSWIHEHQCYGQSSHLLSATSLRYSDSVCAVTWYGENLSFCYFSLVLFLIHDLKLCGSLATVSLLQREIFSRGVSKGIHPCRWSSGDTSHCGMWVAKSCMYPITSLLHSLWPASEPLQFLSVMWFLCNFWKNGLAFAHMTSAWLISIMDGAQIPPKPKY